MKCANHPEKEPVAACELCGQGFCEECVITLEGRSYCKKCLREKISTSTGEQKLTGVVVPEKKKRFWAFMFSLVPGMGYMYLGLMNRGLQTMVLFFGSIFVSGFIGFEQLMALIAPVVIFYSIFDTQQVVKDINKGITVVDRPLFDTKKLPFTQAWLGYVLIVVGLLALLQNVMPYYFPFWMALKRVIPPALIIAAGIAILYRNTRKEV